ncbi:ATP-dependent helicase HrpB [Meiothermus granaticius]|uniref:ATP-dependent helicase HrpB n=1 Tax=Meiothermus granaticius NBRC 107808 TaxID=1227551 RepID=A0A399F917_9DEIN|nr:ATP-dependent helicase HrpB [Meiothermus granaticius]RIH92166.1 ATP-dependent helicase HrpB [Meiothermus granaticius NBRC 107808]GEM86569.1 ATP-dependent helicase HrpB [Meiothermus granaticius NBRC 107808]
MPALPIHTHLPALRAALKEQPIVILQAPPGAGKSTVVPLELLHEPWLRGQKIVMLEPRRLAARAVAARMAAQLGEALGQTVGYRVRFESQVSPQTRLEVLTEGILTRWLQRDPGLEGIGLVIFDEFHERSLESDLALALVRQVQALLREDLRLLLMSATLEAKGLSAALGEAPVLQAEGRQYPVELHYLPKDPEGPLPGTVAAGISRALSEARGDVLAFLPGVGEIARTQAILAERHPEVLIRPLYGDLPLEAQQAALLPDPQRRKVVLATSIAETSLTIEGIGVVVDSGFARASRFDPGSGLPRLETVRVTRDAADQRAGRAGRLGPGVAYRLWSEPTQRGLLAQRPPEILEADLTPLLLTLAAWGIREVNELSWITPPPPGAIRQAQALLQTLGALEGGGLSPRGEQMLEWPTHPRIAHLLLESRSLGLQALAADVAALLEERDPLPRAAGADLDLRVQALRQWRAGQRGEAGGLKRLERLAQEWRRRLGTDVDNRAPDPYATGLLLAQAYPDRVAQLREGSRTRYRLSGGRGVRLSEEDPLAGSGWLVAAHLDAGNEEGRVFLAAPVHPEELKPLAQTVEAVGWDAKAGALIARQELRLGQVLLESQPLQHLSEARRVAILLEVVRSEGLELLPWSEALRQWQARVLSLRSWRPQEGWPEVSDAGLLEGLEAWLGPWLGGISRREGFQRLDLGPILTGLLSWEQQRRLDELAPTHLEVPSGSRIRLTYSPEGSPPVLAVKLQELFGLADTPRVNAGRTPVMLHLLSPAQRPIQITQDLRSFWQNTYPEVRKELRGRYNKHPWPEDPWSAEPTRKTHRRGR